MRMNSLEIEEYSAPSAIRGGFVFLRRSLEASRIIRARIIRQRRVGLDELSITSCLRDPVALTDQAVFQARR